MYIYIYIYIYRRGAAREESNPAIYPGRAASTDRSLLPSIIITVIIKIVLQAIKNSSLKVLEIAINNIKKLLNSIF